MQGHAESAQTLQQFCPYRNQDFFLHIFPINKGLMLCTLSSSLGGLLTFYDPFLIKVDQPENLFSLEVFIFFYTSNLCQPQKVLNIVTFSWSKGVQFSSVAQSCLTLCDPMNRSRPPVHHHLPEFTQTHVH